MFELSPHIDKNKIFLINLSEIEKRLDPFYYIPYISKLEKEVRKHNPKPLRYYVKYIAGGATPKTSEKEKYYSDKENGIPFLRVQNLSPTGHLQLDDVKYINKETHNGYLKRSQVSGGDLLVKITGVGRMAVASVAPDGFVGNTNQHMVVIKTASKETSLILASYLNTDIGEKLASRRATGGTRPALDYSALLSIPIIFDKKILEIMEQAVVEKQQKEAEAEHLLNSIDNYLLGELGITLLEKDNSLENRMYKVNFCEVTGDRWDAEYFSKFQVEINKNIKRSKYKIEKIKNVAKFQPGYAFSSNDYVTNSDCILITIKNISKNTISLKNTTYLPSNFYEQFKIYQIFKDDLIIAMTGATIGKVGIFDINKRALLNQRNGIIRSSTINTYYLMNLLNAEIYQNIILRNAVGGAQPNISETNIMGIYIPVPPIEKQNEIAEYIKAIREQAKRLKAEAKEVLELAKQEVEKMILGEL